jgi:hypothetical protein
MSDVLIRDAPDELLTALDARVVYDVSRGCSRLRRERGRPLINSTLWRLARAAPAESRPAMVGENACRHVGVLARWAEGDSPSVADWRAETIRHYEDSAVGE